MKGFEILEVIDRKTYAFDTYVIVAKKKKKLVEYLTIVNDRVLPDGSKEFKKTEFLHNLLNDQEKRKEHIENIIAFPQIIIDYRVKLKA